VTRALLAAAVDGSLDDVDFVREPAFGLAVPRVVPGVPAEILDPRAAWPDGEAYDRQAALLRGLFSENSASMSSHAGNAALA
jgi:phosphoenolpyruvate carboxykinase (ATP)